MKKHPHSNAAFNQDLIHFITESPTSFHAVYEMSKRLKAAGFKRLHEHVSWELVNGGRYYVTRNDSTIIAFRMGLESPVDTGIHFVGAHTDSPALKVKPRPEIICRSYLQLGVEVYGGALLNPWFDRDLSMAGRVTCLTEDRKIVSRLIDFRIPLAVISSLAIHLDRDANKKREINPQQDLPPIIMQLPPQNIGEKIPYFDEMLKNQLIEEHPGLKIERILAHEINLYDTQPPNLLGINQEFIAGGRLDNLISCHTGLMSLLQIDDHNEYTAMLVCNDHEEVGSLSTSGAQGPFLESVLNRICPLPQDLDRAKAQSILISADNAHGIHPNYADRFDKCHAPILNQGPVIKINGNQRYASNSETVALFRYLCDAAKAPVQEFVVRSDMSCGSTIGPLTAGRTGIRTVDVGVPTFGMHSIREIAGVCDIGWLYQILCRFWDTRAVFDSAFS